MWSTFINNTCPPSTQYCKARSFKKPNPSFVHQLGLSLDRPPGKEFGTFSKGKTCKVELGQQVLTQNLNSFKPLVKSSHNITQLHWPFIILKYYRLLSRLHHFNSNFPRATRELKLVPNTAATYKSSIRLLRDFISNPVFCILLCNLQVILTATLQICILFSVCPFFMLWDYFLAAHYQSLESKANFFRYCVCYGIVFICSDRTKPVRVSCFSHAKNLPALFESNNTFLFKRKKRERELVKSIEKRTLTNPLTLKTVIKFLYVYVLLPMHIQWRSQS